MFAVGQIFEDLEPSLLEVVEVRPTELVMKHIRSGTLYEEDLQDATDNVRHNDWTRVK